MTLHGYCGRILTVDLSTATFSTTPLDPHMARAYLGASGLGARLYYDLTIARGLQPDALDPVNPLIVMTGPLQGSTLPGSGRFAVCARSPLTGLWGESNCGADFGPTLKFAGYDGIVVTGQSPEPCVLWIDGDNVALRPAGTLWGKDTYDTTDALVAEGGKGAKVLCIGPAGEKQVRYASLVCQKGDLAGRTGMGAVAGAKRLKAIVVRGDTRPTLADPAALAALRRDIQGKIREMVTLQSFKSFGTAGGLYYSSMVGDLAAKNWQLGVADDSAVLGLDGTTMADTILTGSGACYACPVACKRKVAVKDGPFATPSGPGPEYETVASFGLLCMNNDLAAVARANELCNRLGMDTISCGSTIAFAIEATERGLLRSDLTWGDAAAMLNMIECVGLRQGLGDLLAEGVRRVAQQLGLPADVDWAPHVKGLEIPMHDPRAFHGMAVGYATTPRGANHNGANIYIEMGSAVYPEIGLDGELSTRGADGKARLSALSQFIGGVYDALTLCFFDGWAYTVPDLCRAVTSVVGGVYSVDDLMQCGERLWALKRCINTLLGAKAGDDRLPARFLTPHSDGPTAGEAPDLATMLKDFYALCDLDARGCPSAARLASLGLQDVARLVHANPA